MSSSIPTGPTTGDPPASAACARQASTSRQGRSRRLSWITTTFPPRTSGLSDPCDCAMPGTSMETSAGRVVGRAPEPTVGRVDRLRTPRSTHLATELADTVLVGGLIRVRWCHVVLPLLQAQLVPPGRVTESQFLRAFAIINWSNGATCDSLRASKLKLLYAPAGKLWLPTSMSASVVCGRVPKPGPWAEAESPRSREPPSCHAKRSTTG